MATLKELTVEERDVILPVLIKLLERKTSEMNPITSDRIIDFMNYKKDIIGFKKAFDKKRLMKMTNFIRNNGILALCSGQMGYYITKNPDELQPTIDEFESRIKSHLATVKALKQLQSDMRLKHNHPEYDDLWESI